MWESNSYKAHEDCKKLYEALEQSMVLLTMRYDLLTITIGTKYIPNGTKSGMYNSQQMARDHTDQLLTDLAEARKKKKRRHDSSETPPGSPPHQPPPPPPPAGSFGTPGASGAPGFYSKTAASAEYMAWTTTGTRLKPSVLSITEELHMDDDTTYDEQVQSFGDEDIGHDHIPTVDLRQNWWKPFTEDRPATPEPAWSIPSSNLPVLVNNWASALVSIYAPPLENLLLAQTGDMAIFMDWFCKMQGITELKQ
ncbi:hypothetical protein Tco_0341457 [Tanacetum coccineum]